MQRFEDKSGFANSTVFIFSLPIQMFRKIYSANSLQQPAIGQQKVAVVGRWPLWGVQIYSKTTFWGYKKLAVIERWLLLGDDCSWRFHCIALLLPLMFALAAALSLVKCWKFLHLSFIHDGQGTDRQAILYVDRSCCLLSLSLTLKVHKNTDNKTYICWI